MSGDDKKDDGLKWSARRDDTVISRFTDLYLQDDLANDAAREAATEAGEPKPQGWGEYLAASWHEYTVFQPWSATRRGQQRFNEALAEQAGMGARAYVYGDLVAVGAFHNAYTRFLLARYGPYARFTCYPASSGRAAEESSLGVLLFLLFFAGLGIAANLNGPIGLLIVAAILVYVFAGYHPETEKRRDAFEKRFHTFERETGPLFGCLFLLAMSLGFAAVGMWMFFDALRSGTPKDYGTALGSVVVIGSGLVLLLTSIHTHFMQVSKGRGLGGSRCLVTPATAPGDARPLRRWEKTLHENPFGPKLFRFEAWWAEMSPASVASWLADQLSHTSTVSTWKVVSTPKAAQEDEITFTANANYTYESSSYLARSGGQTVRIQTVAGQQTGCNGTIHLETTIRTRRFLGVRIQLEFSETTYPMWLRRQAEATVARTLQEVETALRSAYPTPARQQQIDAESLSPAWTCTFDSGDWATWQVVDVPGYALLELAPQ